tara:strand:- start:10484 stop:10633 length:150 start_codon:yes stop_codon:yes gene_type:complete
MEVKIQAEKLAKYYDVGRTCIFNYKKGSQGKQRLYNAMVENYSKNNKDK